MLSKRAYRYVVLVLLTALLSACGFHLRETSALPGNLRATALQDVIAFSELDMAFRRAFSRAGHALVEQETADTFIKVIKDRFERRVLSVNTAGDPNEYELTYTLSVTLLDAQGKELVPRQSVKQYRSYTFNPDILLAKDAEENRLKQSMVNDAVRQVMRRISVKLKSSTL